VALTLKYLAAQHLKFCGGQEELYQLFLAFVKIVAIFLFCFLTPKNHIHPPPTPR